MNYKILILIFFFIYSCTVNTVNKNTIVFNTCGVTNEAERQARQSIRKYKKK